MTKKTKNKLYCMFVMLILCAYSISKIRWFLFSERSMHVWTALFKYGIFGTQIVDRVCTFFFIIVIFLALRLLRKYRLLQNAKKGIIIILGIVIVLFLCAADFAKCVFTLPDRAMRLYELRYALGMLEYIVVYLGVIGIIATFRKKNTEVENVSIDSISQMSQNDSHVNSNSFSNIDLREAIYKLYCDEVKKALKAPRTAVFCDIDEIQIIENYGIYVVNGWVDSQNTYGAMIRTNIKIEVANENGRLVSKTNLHISAQGKVIRQLAYYHIIAFFIVLILTTMIGIILF